MEMKKAIEILITTNESNTQLDLFRSNEQVLLQGYKYKDVKKWGLEIDFGSVDGIVFELMFSPSKTHNRLNFKRFENSVVKEEFKSFERVSQDSYFCFFSSQTSIEEISNFISKTLMEVYGELQGNYFRVAAF